MKFSVLAFALALLLGVPVYADYLYTFSYVATVGPIESFSFSIDSPNLITAGATPTFPAFAITDGSTGWTIDEDLVGISTGTLLGSTLLPTGDGCFSFGTTYADLADYHGCATALTTANGPIQAGFTVDVPGGLPASTGTFSNLLFDGVATAPADEGFFNCCGGATGEFTLTVTEVPEPASFALVAAALGMTGSFLVRRVNYARVNR